MDPKNTGSDCDPRSARLPGGWIAQLAPFALLLATAVYLQLRWDETPARFPVHWGIGGHPNGWSVRTPMGVYGPLLFGAAILAVISTGSFVMGHFARPIRAAAANPLAHEFVHRMSIFMLALEFFVAIVFCFVGLLPFSGNPGVVPILTAATLMLLTLILFIVWVGKSGASYTSNASARPAPNVGGTPNEHWVLGMFYFNRDDTAVWVQKRLGIGYTLNFAHPSAWIWMAVILALPVILVLFALHQAQ